ncbi:protein CIA1-like [Solanum stenotomum]|uniref:protein CIA1-like n=1 Tax=Solanum stenotomum TaxID=172797 RepID=UPI0020D00FAB|nr:protein CIA1-like [Solanum stenotomum]
MKNFSYDDFELREIQKLEGHTGKVLGIAWKVDTGVRGFLAVMASWSDDKTVRIWEENLSGLFVCKAVLEASSTVRSCAWSREYNLLAAGCSDATTVIWKNVADHAYERIYTLKGHENEVRSVSWDMAGLLLATCGGDKSIWIWEALPGNEFDCASVLQGNTEDVKIVQWDDNNTLFSVSSDNTIKVWKETSYNSGDWRCIKTLGESDREHTSAVLSLSFSKDRRKMVSCSDDLTIKIWDSDRDSTELWSHICTPSGYHDTTIFAVDWLRELLRWVPEEEDQDPEIYASAGADDTIHIFIEDKDNEVDGLSFKQLLKKEKAHETNINSVKWHSGDKRRLASASDDGTVKIWEFVCPWPAGRIDP